MPVSPKRIACWRIAGFALLCAASGCLDNKLEDEAEALHVFIAQQSDFNDYKDWTTYENNVTSEHGGLIGTTTVYLNQMPDPGEHTFGIGTILLKTQQVADSDTVTVHAMSKRGSTFNSKGARGWEYFELLLSKSGVPYILWRGDKPPTGEMYQQLLGGKTQPTTEGNCNDCHADGKDGMLGSDIIDLLQ